jgi:SAM-dependent methyltransferase
MINAYDEIAYPSAAFPETHPDRLAAKAKLFGLEPASIDRRRVLEIGAGDGSNLIPMALTSPNASFVGFDLAGEPIKRGIEIARALGLANLNLFQADILDVDLGPDPFDYIIVQGIYSWVPEAVRNELMRLVRRSLAPRGVAYISYNALPGCYVRLAIRRDLQFGARGVASRPARVAAAMQRLAAWPAPSPAFGAFQNAVAEEAARMAKRSIGSLAHDELSDSYHPVFLTDVSAHAAENQLQLMTEAAANEVRAWFWPDDGPGDPALDVIARAQQADFGAVRCFRQGLFVGAETVLTRRPRAEAVAAMHISSTAHRVEGNRFECEGASFDLADPLLANVLEHLGSIWPNTAPVADMITDHDRLLALLDLYGDYSVELHVAPASFTRGGDRPAASPLARLQAGRGETRLTTLRHTMVDVDDAFSRAFVAGLDGTRTRAEIARDIAGRFNLTAEDALAPLGVLLEILARAPLLVA